MSENLSFGPATESLDDTFAGIVQENFAVDYVPAEAPSEAVPFGPFVEESRVDANAANLASSTGWTGNNGEESA